MVSRRVKRKQELKSTISQRTVYIAGRITRISVEDVVWKDFKEIARASDMSASGLVRAINSERRHPNLSSAIRLFVLDHYRRKLGASKATESIQRIAGMPGLTVIG